MKISAVLRYIGKGVIDLVEERHVLLGDIFHGDAAGLAEGHLPVAVKSAGGINANRQRNQRRVGSLVGIGDEIANRAFYRRVFTILPIDAQNSVTIESGWRHPDMLISAGPFDICQGPNLTGLDNDAGGNLPAPAKVTRGSLPGTVHRHAALAFFTIEVFRADRAGFRV